ncbi:hypothetical protein B0T19DRAFT_262446 [Cercophora scortea]|uniref:DUF7779 domain-containing protein n=1 Tax=Cercophora scortea TaxID=314031 RepID=A0AAE0IAR2_9PEZI|nr:hypothetical protein B0T19DRAFT_262446 [Cercophora scortea]
MMTSAKTVVLRRLTPAPKEGTATHRISVVAVPDIGGYLPSHWQDGAQPWLLSTLPTAVLSPCVLEVSYPNEGTSCFKWEDLLSYGDSLLSQLLVEAELDKEFCNRPLVLVAHGLGGYVVKKAVTRIVKQRSDPPFRGLAKALSGIILLCSPHTPADSEDEALALDTLLRACSGMSTRQVAQCRLGLADIFHLSREFQGEVGDIVVISAYETVPTKLGLFSARREILVGKRLALIGARNEVVIPAEQPHPRGCNLRRDGVLFREVFDLFASLGRDDRAYYTPTEETGSQNTWTGTSEDELKLVDVTAVGADMDDAHHSTSIHGDCLTPPQTSNQATAGSSDMYSFDLVPLPTPIATRADDRVHVHLPCFMVQPHERNTEFYGRTDVLHDLDEALLPKPGEADLLRTFALCGMGGVGKTQVAVEFVFSRREHFDAIFIVQASSHVKLAQGFSNMAGVLGLEPSDKPSSDQVVSRDLVLGWLANPTRSLHHDGGGYEERGDNVIHWLLVFDNADTLDLLSEFWPVAPRGSILITSRDPRAQTNAYIPAKTRGRTLEPLSPEETAALLRRLTGYDTTEQDRVSSLAVAGLLGGLPLAVTQVAATIVRRDMSFAEVVELYKEDAGRKSILDPDINGKVKSVYPKTIFTTWALHDLDERARSLLDILAYLDPDQIHEGILVGFLDTPAADTDTDTDNMTLPGFPQNLNDYLDARLALVRSSLVRRNTESRELAIHRLVQDSAQLSMTPERQTKVLRAVVAILYRAWPFGINDYDTQRWKTCELVFPHIQHMMAQLHQVASTRRQAASDLLGPAGEKFAHLLTDAGWYHLERGNPAESIPFQDLAQQLFAATASPDALRLSEVHQAQAESLIMVGRFEDGLQHAYEALKLVQAAQKAGQDPGHRLPQAYNEVAEAYCNLGRESEAIPLCDQAIGLYLAQEGLLAHYESSCFARLNKAFCLRRLGRNNEASQVLEELLDMRLRLRGSVDKSQLTLKTGLTYVYLGDVRLNQGRFAEAKELHWKAHEELLGSLGPNHFWVGGLLYRLALYEIRDDRLEKARDLLLQAAKIHEDKPYFAAELARTWDKLSMVSEKLGDSQSAAKAGERVAKLLSALSATARQPVSVDMLEQFFHEWAL